VESGVEMTDSEMSVAPTSSQESFGTPTLGGTCCLISHKCFFRVDGRYCSHGGFNRYVEVIRAMFDRVLLAVPVEQGAPDEDVAPLAEGVAEVVELPSYYRRHHYPICWLRHPLGLGKPLLKAIRRADVTHIPFPGYAQVYGLLLARWLKRPHFCSLVGDWEEEYAVSSAAQSHPILIKPLLLFQHMLVRWVLRSQLVFTHGRKLTERYRGWGANVVQNQSTTFHARDIRSTDTLQGVHQPAKLLFVGRLDYKKGVPVLIEAVKKMRDEGVSTQLSIVGGGPDRDKFEALVKELGLLDSVCFLGYVRDRQRLRELCREHDLFVLPSLTEGAPKVVIEAYAQGLPVVATNVGGIPGMVSDDNGILVEPGNVTQLADAIGRILEDDEFRLKLARNNLVEARTKTMEAQVEHMTRHIRACWPNMFKDES